MLAAREASQLNLNLVDFDQEAARNIAQPLANKLNAQLGEEIGRGAMGIVYAIRTDQGEGRDMILKVTQFPHEKKGYTLARWKKRALQHKNPELSSILPEVGTIVDDIYDFKEGYYSGYAIKVYGIPVERLEPLPDRLKEQLFGHGGQFKSKEAEKEWVAAVSDPKTLIPTLRDNFGEKMYRERDGDRYYTYFAEIPPNEASGDPGKSKIEQGQQFEQMVLDLPPPQSFQDYLLRWMPQIRRRAMRFADLTPTSSSIYTSPKEKLSHQAGKLAKRLEDTVKVPQYPPEALPYFGIEGAHPSGETEGVVDQFFNKLQALGAEGVKFWDTHRGNVMMRPSTNEIVVSDVGLFKKGPKTRKEGIERVPQVIGAKSKHKTIYREDNSMFDSEEKGTHAIDLFLRMVEKLESIDKSIDYLAAVMSGTDPLEIELGQKAMGRLSTPRDVRKRKEVAQGADITETLTVNGKLLKSLIEEEIKNILKERKNEVK